MSSRAFGLDVNSGIPPLVFDEATPLSKFGHSYKWNETFAATIRVRNENCTGWRDWPYTEAPYNTPTILTMLRGAQAGELEARDAAQLYLNGADPKYVRLYDESVFQLRTTQAGFSIDGVAGLLFPGSYDFLTDLNFQVGVVYTIGAVWGDASGDYASEFRFKILDRRVNASVIVT